MVDRLTKISPFVGNMITKSPSPPTNNFQDTPAPGVWSMDEVDTYVTAGTWPTLGNTPNVATTFNTFVYDGNASARSIDNEVSLSGGGMVWIRSRDNTKTFVLSDTARGAGYYLQSQDNASSQANAQMVTSFDSDGFSLGTADEVNGSSERYVAWSFKNQGNFFEALTWTGNGVSGRTVSHNLGSVPGMMIVKNATDGGENWVVYHRGVDGSSPEDYGMRLNGTNARVDESSYWNDTAPTATEFSVGNSGNTNSSGKTFVGYLFGHDTSSNGMIYCGNYTGSASDQDITAIGWQPQWLLIKRTDSTENWLIFDTVRGLTFSTTEQTTASQQLYPNSTAVESAYSHVRILPTGFGVNGSNAEVNASSGNYIYVAIRDQMMNEPTASTSVFTPTAYTGNGTSGRIVPGTGFPVDVSILKARGATGNWLTSSRFIGRESSSYNWGTVNTNLASGAQYDGGTTRIRNFDNMTGVEIGDDSDVNQNTSTYINYSWKRAKGFFDCVCYTGTGSNMTVSHNLGVVPEMMWVTWLVGTGGSGGFQVYFGDATDYLVLNSNAARTDHHNRWNDTAPTSTVFSLGTNATVNAAASAHYTAFLFATLAGVSKVGTFTQSGATDVDCGFTSGSRFVMLKRTDSTGDWFVFDSARGIAAGNDPLMYFNTTAADVTGSDYIDPLNAGFSTTTDITDGDYFFYAIA